MGIFVYVADQIISAWFLLDSVMKLSGNYIRIEIEHAYGRSMTPTTIFVQSGLLEFIVSLICFGRSSFSSFGGWIRIVRLISITFSFLTLIPQIDVLMVRNDYVAVYVSFIFLHNLCFTSSPDCFTVVGCPSSHHHRQMVFNVFFSALC